MANSGRQLLGQIHLPVKLRADQLNQLMRCNVRRTRRSSMKKELNMQEPKLPTRRLGSTELEISLVAFGAWAIGGGGWSFGWGAQDDDASLEAVRQAVEIAINCIDTAAVYRLG